MDLEKFTKLNYDLINTSIEYSLIYFRYMAYKKKVFFSLAIMDKGIFIKHLHNGELMERQPKVKEIYKFRIKNLLKHHFHSQKIKTDVSKDLPPSLEFKRLTKEACNRPS